MWRNRAKQKHYLFLFSQNVKKNQAFMILFWQALGFYPFLGRVLCILLGLFRKIFENDAIETQILLSDLMKAVKKAWLKFRFELRLVLNLGFCVFVFTKTALYSSEYHSQVRVLLPFSVLINTACEVLCQVCLKTPNK